MKKGLIILGAILVAGVASFCLMRSHKIAEREALLRDCLPELAWFRTDLNLTDGQLEKVTAIHTAYVPRCAEMCRRVAFAREKLTNAAKERREMSPEVETAIREHAETRSRCQQEMLKHLYETAAVLDKDQAARYLEAMLPFALDCDANDSNGSQYR